MIDITTEAKRTEWLPALANSYKPDSSVDADGVIRGGQKISRNVPCPCGSGKKWKHCHGEE